MKTIYKVLATVFLLTGILPSKAQEKVIYPLPLLHETVQIWGYAYNYDRKRQVIDYLFESADQFESATGLARVFFEGYAGAIDINGKFVIEPIYDNISFNPYSKTYIVELDEKYGEVNKYGELIKPVEYESLAPQQKKGWYEFTVGDEFFYLAPDGHVTSNWSDYLNAPFEEWD